MKRSDCSFLFHRARFQTQISLKILLFSSENKGSAVLFPVSFLAATQMEKLYGDGWAGAILTFAGFT